MTDFNVGDLVKSNLTGLEYEVVWCGKTMVALVGLSGGEGMGYIDEYSPVPEPFFVVGQVYHKDGYKFDVVHVGLDPTDGTPTAFGWLSEPRKFDAYSTTRTAFTGWVWEMEL